MRHSLKKPLEYGTHLSYQMQKGNFDLFVKHGDPSLKRVSQNVSLPLRDDAKQTVSHMVGVMQHVDCPLVLDSLSAPMLGKQYNMIMMSMKLRNSHFRNLPESANFSYQEKVLLMINPKMQEEPHSSSSWQYECDFMMGKKCRGLQLVNRQDFVQVAFQSTSGQRHHMILPFRESRLL